MTKTKEFIEKNELTIEEVSELYGVKKRMAQHTVNGSFNKGKELASKAYDFITEEHNIDKLKSVLKDD